MYKRICIAKSKEIDLLFFRFFEMLAGLGATYYRRQTLQSWNPSTKALRSLQDQQIIPPNQEIHTLSIPQHGHVKIDGNMWSICTDSWLIVYLFESMANLSNDLSFFCKRFINSYIYIYIDALYVIYEFIFLLSYIEYSRRFIRIHYLFSN